LAVCQAPSKSVFPAFGDARDVLDRGIFAESSAASDSLMLSEPEAGLKPYAYILEAARLVPLMYILRGYHSFPKAGTE
jgi:hypothetical protein